MSRRAARELQEVAAALVEEKEERRLGGSEALDVSAERRLRGWYVVDGLSATNPWTDVFEPVRRRFIWSRTWRELQSPETAKAAIREFLVRRPDAR